MYSERNVKIRKINVNEYGTRSESMAMQRTERKRGWLIKEVLFLRNRKRMYRKAAVPRIPVVAKSSKASEDEKAILRFQMLGSRLNVIGLNLVKSVKNVPKPDPKRREGSCLWVS